ncbi:hypothetical protein QN277_006449 [Acacia crassicarpa]|uniref:Uncharacterized protein n=1 Tax=Acacia crassicarpa TaxID=499986 RepID=A0AAE1ME89_9FABA|nr:hypothetical protein QN277_006449 [Acacia crassicarpa]
MQIFRWRDVLSLKAYAVPSITTSTHFASFHSTPYSCEKWKNKWNSAIRGGQLPSKSYAKYVMRQKRADAKKALKDLLYRSGSSKFSFESQETWKFGDRNFHADQNYDSESCCNKCQAKSHQQPGKSRKKVKREFFCVHSEISRHSCNFSELLEKAKERLSLKTLILILRQLSKLHLVTDATPGPLETGRSRSVSIQPLALNGGNIQIGQSQTAKLGNGKAQVMLSPMMTATIHAM